MKTPVHQLTSMPVLDATKKAEQRTLLEAELDAVGIRLNKVPP